MVAKRVAFIASALDGLNLAKIHMVAKLPTLTDSLLFRLNLAKIHMVAKRWQIQE